MKSDTISWRFLRRAASAALSRKADVEIVGLEHLPGQGPVVLAARHYHHLFDGCVLLSLIDRPAHIVVGLDWVANRGVRRIMDRLCMLARWPIVLRSRLPGRPAATFSDRDRRSVLRQSARDVTALLRDGRVVIMFPEGYPNIDPSYTPKSGEGFLPFEAGFLRFAAIAQRHGVESIAIVPVGLAYEHNTATGRWRIVVRFGEARTLRPGDAAASLLPNIEHEVHRLSGHPRPGGQLVTEHAPLSQ